MNALNKLVCLVIIALAMLFYTTLLPFISFALIISTTAILVGFYYKKSFRSIAPVLIVSFFLGLFHLLVDEGTPLKSYGFISISKEGFNNAIIYSLRLFVVSVATITFVWTIELSELEVALQSLGVPYRFAFLVSYAIRSVTLIGSEVGSINVAIKLRTRTQGLYPKAVFHRIWLLLTSASIRTLLIGQTSAVALASRGFDPYSERTTYRNMHTNVWGWIITSILLVITIGMKWLEIKGMSHP